MTSSETTAPNTGAKDGAVPVPEAAAAPPPTETTTAPASAAAVPAVTDDAGVNPLDFSGEVDSNDALPSAETLAKIADHTVLDRDGKPHTFASLAATTPRVLFVFVRHFYCGNCQDYLRTLSEAVTPEERALHPPFPSHLFSSF